MQMQQETNERTNKLCLPINRCDNGPEWPATSRPKPIQAGHKKATKINTEVQRERERERERERKRERDKNTTRTHQEMR